MGINGRGQTPPLHLPDGITGRGQAPPLHLPDGCCCIAPYGCLLSYWYGEYETCSSLWRVFCSDRTAMRFYNCPYDCQSQTTAPCSDLTGAIGTIEEIKQSSYSLWWNASARVSNGNFE